MKLDTKTLDAAALDQLFRRARSHNAWQQKEVPDSLLRALHDVMKWGPTSANSWPMRVVFVKSAAAKARLLPCMAPGNIDKTQSAPVVAIIGMDMAFYDRLPQLFPHTDARAWFIGNQELVNITAMRNSSLQGGYLMLAARALGLDCGPMSGFDNAKVDLEFFPGNMVRSNFICALGYGDASKVHPRSPRPEFDEVHTIV
jgi:3-hydroxypropanoate dehydrogenase